MKTIFTGIMFWLLAMTIVGATAGDPPVSSELQESINDVEDYIEWMTWDIEEGHIDSVYGSSYIENFQITLSQLNQLK